MNDRIYITNKTDKLMHATISDNYTGSNILCYDLVPGSNEITFKSLDSGVYLIALEDHNHDIFYTQKITRN